MSEQIVDAATALKKKELLSVYIGAYKLLKHYDDVYNQYQAIVDVEVKEPAYTEVPDEDSKIKLPKKSHAFLISLIGILLGVGLVLGTNYYLISEGYYTTLYHFFIIKTYTITEVEVAGVAIAVLFFLIAIINKAVSHHAETVYLDEVQEYEDNRNAIISSNQKLKEDYESKKKVADETQVINKMKRENLKTTMYHLQQEYMLKYSKAIPADDVDLEVLSNKIKELEAI